MKTAVKWTALYLAFFAAFCILTPGCRLIGANPSPPTKFEQALFTTVTNYVLVTNTVPVAVPVYHTNEIVFVRTNELNQVITLTSNVVNQVWVTNTVAQVVAVPQYSNTVKPDVSGDVGVLGGVVNTFFPGAGTIVSQGILAILGLWGFVRSSKNGNTSITLAQQIETIREFIKTLPNGKEYDSELVKWLQAHQNETGAAAQVAALLQNRINNADAKVAAQSVIDAVNALRAIATPIPPVNAGA